MSTGTQPGSTTRVGGVCHIGKFFVVTFEKESGGTESIIVEAASEPGAVSLAMDEGFRRYPSDNLRLFLVREHKLYGTDNVSAR